MKKAIAYLRKSTNAKDRQVLSLETQRYEIGIAHKRAEDYFHDEVEIIAWYEEKVTGTSHERPEFMKLSERFKNGEADVLLAWGIDRISRNHDDNFFLIKALEDGTIPYIQDAKRMWTQENTGLDIYLALGLSVNEAKQISRRVKDGMNTLIRKGGVPFMVPFGARNVRDKSLPIEERVVIDPIERRYARRMFEMRAEGKSYREIGDYLFEHGYKSKNGGRINSSTIEGWIKNSFYYGVIKWGQQTWTHIYEPIVEKSLWERANNVGRGFIPRLKKDMFPLKGIVKSAESGRVLTASMAKKVYPQYHTHARWKEKVSISEARIFEIFEEQIPFYAVTEEVKPYILKAIRDMYKVNIDALQAEKTRILGDITKNSNQSNNLLDLRVSEEINAEQFQKKQQEYVSKEISLQKELNNLLKRENVILTSIDNAVELLVNLSDTWKNADAHQKGVIIKMIVVELFVTPEKELIIRENAVFEALRLLNFSYWSGETGSNRHTQGLKP